MKSTPVKLGPLSLLLTVISICLTVLAILTYTTAGADMRLAEKYAQTVSTRAELERRGQEFLSEADEAAGEGSLSLIDGLERDAEGVLWYTLEKDGSRLRIGLRQEGDGVAVDTWKQDREWTEDLSLGNLWPGF